MVDNGPDRYGRTIGIVSCAGRDAATEQVRAGMAWVFVKYARTTRRSTLSRPRLGQLTVGCGRIRKRQRHGNGGRRSGSMELAPLLLEIRRRACVLPPLNVVPLQEIIRRCAQPPTYQRAEFTVLKAAPADVRTRRLVD